MVGITAFLQLLQLPQGCDLESTLLLLQKKQVCKERMVGVAEVE